MKKNILFAILFIVVLIFLFFVNTGFSAEARWQDLQTIIFAIVFFINLLWPKTGKLILLSTIPLLLLMVVFFTLGQFDQANIFGSTAIGLAVLVLIGNLPQLIKKGYIERI